MSSKLITRNLNILENLSDIRKSRIYSTNSLFNKLNKNSKQFFVSYSAIKTNNKNKNCFELLTKRSFSQNTESDDQNENPIQRRGHLMAFEPILVPNLWYKWKNYLTVNTIIRPFFDNEFTLDKFMFGSKQALVHISNCLSDGNIDSLQGLITDEALYEIRRNFSLMNRKQIQDLRLQLEDIVYSFPYRIGIIMNERDDKRWVEITVVYYCLYKYQTLTEKNNLSFKEFTHKFGPNITICNYRFIREYTKGVDSDWTVNLLGHFQNRGVF